MDRKMEPSTTTDNSAQLHGTTRRVWDYILKYAIAYGGRLPSSRQTGRAVGTRSNNTIWFHMQKLMEMGLIGQDANGYFIEGGVFIPPQGWATEAHEAIIKEAFSASNMVEVMQMIQDHEARVAAVEIAEAQRVALTGRMVNDLPFLFGAAAAVGHSEN